MRRALGLGNGVVRGREQGSSPLVITLVLSPKLSIGDVGKAAEGDVVLNQSIVIGGVGCSVQVFTSTGHSLVIPLELSVRGVGGVTVGARLTPELSIRIVKAVCCETKRLQCGYLRDCLLGRRTVEQSEASLPFYEESEWELVRLVAMPRQLPRSL